jgi:tripartite-type tricarboxylate transporter receptor subunit TctC
MKLRRRQFLQLATSAVALPVVPRIARAQAYPTRPARIIVPYPAGAFADISARLVGQWLSEHFGQQFVIENRPGAGGNIGTEVAVRAPPDGYTLLLINTGNASNATLYPKLNFVFIRDISPVAGIVRVPHVMEVNPSFPAKTVPEFITYAKANPGKVNMASGGIGAPTHLSGELFKLMTGVNLVHVPYRGGAPALADLLGGQVQVMFDQILTSIGYIKSGQLRPLAVTSAARTDALPSISTVNEFVPGYEMTSWTGIGVPRNTPGEIISKLNKEINAALASPVMRARFADFGGTALAGTPADIGKLIAEETEKWAKVVDFAGTKAD